VTDGVDAGVESGVDAGVEFGVDAGVEPGVEPGVDAGVESGVGLGVGLGVGEIHPVVPKLVKVYNGPPGNVLVEPIMITVLVDTLTAVHLSFTEKDPNGYAIEYPTLLSLQSNI
jgi:hypothetical protein